MVSMANFQNADHATAIKHFWDRYIQYLLGHWVKPNVARWYVIRAEQYIKSFPDKRLAEHDPEDVVGYLKKQGRNTKLADWQFQQNVDAIQKLFEMIGAPWLGEVDWQHWMSSTALSGEHDTLAREAPAEETITRMARGKGSLAKVRRLHGDTLKQLLIEVRQRGYSIRTEKTYEAWTARFIGYHGNRDPRKLGAEEVKSYLQHLAVQRNVAASTQNQALNALVFFYDQALKQPLGELGDFIRAKRPKRLPVVLTSGEVQHLLEKLQGPYWLMASMLYGAGMRLMVAVRLRVQDVDFGYRQIVIRDGKGKKDRVVPLPARLAEPLAAHLNKVRQLHREDLEQGHGKVFLPGALARKYPNADAEWRWQYVFPSGRLSVDPRSGQVRRHHHDLYPCSQSWRAGGAQSAGSAVIRNRTWKTECCAFCPGSCGLVCNL